MAQIGKKAPSFTLENQDGKMVKISDFKGSKVVLFAFPKANTSG
jgi:peroxiredoxin Q/BCP